MAVRVENGSSEDFGEFVAEVDVTHARASVGSTVLVTRPLTTQRTVAAGGRAEFAVGAIDLVFPSNDLENDGYSALLALAFDGTNSLNIDLMTSDSDVVADSGYSQQAVSHWDRSTEAD